jgi:hypothetical protein
MGWAKRLRHELWVSIGSWRGFGIGGIQRCPFRVSRLLQLLPMVSSRRVWEERTPYAPMSPF